MRGEGEIGPKETCWEACPGTVLKHEGPHINWSNHNTTVLLRLLYEEPRRGEWKAEEIPMVLRKVIGAKNSRKRREAADRPFEESGGPGTGQCGYVDIGNTDEQTMRRLEQLEELLVFAATNNYKVVWA